jgi:hypothetical protein
MINNNQLLKIMALAIPMTVAGIHAAAINAAPAIDDY